MIKMIKLSFFRLINPLVIWGGSPQKRRAYRRQPNIYLLDPVTGHAACVASGSHLDAGRNVVLVTDLAAGFFKNLRVDCHSHSLF